MRGSGKQLQSRTAGQLRSIARLQAFAAAMKRAPTAGECGAGIMSAKRNLSLPAYSSLQYHFGSFGAALEAAGLTPRPPGLRLDREPGIATFGVKPDRCHKPNPHTVRDGFPMDSATNRIDCPKDRRHQPRMIQDRSQFGVPMGRLIAWCYDCRREIPNEPVPVMVSEAERAREPHFNVAVLDTPAARKRNAAIRLAFANGKATQIDLARKYGLSQERVATIIHGRRRSA
jgi:hypothetical protein